MKNLYASIVLAAALIVQMGCGTALTTAAKEGDIPTLQKLLDGGANINENGMANTYAGPPLSHAAYACRVDAAKYLISRGADVSATGTGAGGQRPLHVAARYNCVEVAKVLLDAGADINLRANDTWGSPLVFAAHDGNVKMVKFLIERGADVDDAMAVLKKHGREDDLALLQRYEQRAKAGVPQGTPVAPDVVRSDVDDLPPAQAKVNKNAYAVVIGIENYRQKLPRADFAAQDARLVTSYLTRALGYPAENITSLVNEQATSADLVKSLEKWLPNNVEPDSSVFVYFSGHGAPNPTTGDAYLVPYDGDPTYIAETGYSLKRLYDVLGRLQAKEVTVALDSCFSGSGGRSVIAKGARPIVMTIDNPVLLSRKITVFSASAGNQISSTYDEKGHGLFTYFFLKGIKEEKVIKQGGSLELNSLYAYIRPQVESIAKKKYNNEQTPQLMGANKQ
jgi:hypothetical protein